MQRYRRQLLCCAVRQPHKKERTRDGVFYTRPLLIGNSVLLFGRKDSAFPLQMLVGPDWPFMVATNLLILAPSVLFLVNVASRVSPVAVALGLASCLLLLALFNTTACSDPGIVYIPPDDADSSAGLDVDEERAELSAPDSLSAEMVCSQCLVRRPLSASHCYECSVCVDRLDHHCPWTGKCIGAKNLLFFHAFLWALGAHIALVVACCAYAWAQGIDVFGFPYQS